MSWVMRVLLETAEDKPSSLIAKFPSSSSVNREGAKRYNMYGREVNFYQEISGSVDLQTPDCYFSEFDESSNDFVILLEDLTEWQIGDQTAGCSLAEAKTLISALARFHASGWEPHHQFPDIPSHGGKQQIEGMEGTYPIGWPVVLEQFGDFIPESIRSAGESIPKHMLTCAWITSFSKRARSLSLIGNLFVPRRPNRTLPTLLPRVFRRMFENRKI